MPSVFQQSVRTHGAQTRMKQYMELGGQTREVELRIGEVCLELGQE